MAGEAQQPFSAGQTRQTLERLEAAGLLRGLGNAVYEMHPALERYARRHGARLLADAAHAATWERAFVEILARLAYHYTPKDLHEQRPVFELFGASFERVLALAQRADNLTSAGALLQALAAHAFKRRDLPLAGKRFEAFARHSRPASNGAARIWPLAPTTSSAWWPRSGATSRRLRTGTASR